MAHRTVARLPIPSLLWTLAALAALAATGAFAAAPPAYLNYQGVLRDAANTPLDDRYDMVFRFRSGTGQEILIDKHTTTEGGFVTVTEGLFNVTLGGGLVQDGSGPGNYTSLAEVFRDHDEVYLEIQVNNEVLSPAVRLHAAAYALNARYFNGRSAGEFIDTSSTEQTKSGRLTLFNANPAVQALFAETTAPNGTALFARGTQSAAIFQQSGVSGATTTVAGGGYGVFGQGVTAGGYFADLDGNGIATVGTGSTGVLASGVTGVQAYGTGTGVDASGSTGIRGTSTSSQGVVGTGPLAGGYFAHTGTETLDYGRVGMSGFGIQAYGSQMGGYFADSNETAEAYIAVGNIGVDGRGSQAGGSFFDTNESGFAQLGVGHYGISSQGTSGGGTFTDSNSSGLAFVATGDRGVWAKGTFAGGTFSHPDNVTHWADVSTPTRKIVGTGTVSFVQNHPHDRGKVIVYAAPEGDEVAVYTRGSARLLNGTTRVALGETFALVANPDIGLTAHLTPRGRAADLYVESVSTRELIVRGPAGSDAAFDYLVHGLRIGFEDLAIVQRKELDAFLPDPVEVARSHGGDAELRASTALERFRVMDAGLGRPVDLEMAGARALAAHVDEGRDEILAVAARVAQAERPHRDAPSPRAESVPADLVERVERSTASAATRETPSVVTTPAQVVPSHPALDVTVSAEAGDVLALDPDHAGALRRASSAFDSAVAGCAVEPAEAAPLPPGQARVATSGVAVCKVDASFGAIAVGDLLTPSTNPGHAMRAGEYAQGAILGKAMEPLADGAGTIRVLVTLR